MKEPINQDDLNRILLKPRVNLRFEATKEEILALFNRRLKEEPCRFPSRIVDHHVVIDVPAEEENFWSPQLHVEVEQELRRAREQLRDEASALSIQLASELLRAQVTDTDRDRLLDEFTAKIEQPSSNGSGS